MTITAAILIEAGTVFCSVSLLVSGIWAAGGKNYEGRALAVFICGSLLAGLVAASPWIGWQR